MLNPETVSQAVKQLIGKYNENQMIRIKFPDTPNKWANSETDLFSAINDLQAIATQPELYHILISKKAHETILFLIVHENTDISAKAIAMLQEISDVDDLKEQELAMPVIDELMKLDLIDTLIANLDRFETIGNSEELTAINNTLSTIDNLIDLSVKISDQKLHRLIDWMLKTVSSSKDFSSVKLSILELLSILLMSSQDLVKYLGDMNGIEVLLQQIANYRRKSPETAEEHEYLEQVIGCLCTVLLKCDSNKELFLAEEGPNLIELILRDKSPCIAASNLKLGCLKLFNHALTTSKNRDSTTSKCCEQFIETGGLRVLFPIFLNPKLVLSKNKGVKKKELRLHADEVEEHSAAIILAMLKYTQDKKCLQRLLVKFAENQFEKTLRLIDLHSKYFTISSISTAANRKNGNIGADSEDDTTDLDEDSTGKFTLKTVDYVFLLVCYLCNHFDIYAPDSGEIFTGKVRKLLADKPDIGGQMLSELRTHLAELHSVEERNSLELITKHFGELLADEGSA